MVKKSVHLPDELIIEILLRLSVKTLLRIKCVCKSWLSLISLPYFATSHFQLAVSRPTHGLVLLKTYSSDDHKALIVDFDASLKDDSSYAPLTHHFQPPGISCRKVKIGGSCRGFIFLHTHTDFYLWNPSTRVHTKIPASPVVFVSKSNIHPYTFLYGFAYDHKTDDYLIVLGSSYSPASSIDLEIFSLRANKWEQIEIGSHFPYITRVIYGEVGLLLNNTIHWVVFNYETSRDVIIAFDIKERKMSEIALPCDVCATDCPHDFSLSVLGGLISASVVEMQTVKIWVMQNYAMHSSWTKIIEFSFGFVPLHSLAIAFFTNCGDIIGTDNRGGLVKFNDKGQQLEHRKCGKGYDADQRFKRSQMVVYTESMLSLPCGTGEA
ncbi:unnamed protein product [Lathyrus sativus]|nr:unnamed protein product [Lathyrus sativus]